MAKIVACTLKTCVVMATYPPPTGKLSPLEMQPVAMNDPRISAKLTTPPIIFELIKEKTQSEVSSLRIVPSSFAPLPRIQIHIQPVSVKEGTESILTNLFSDGNVNIYLVRVINQPIKNTISSPTDI